LSNLPKLIDSSIEDVAVFTGNVISDIINKVLIAFAAVAVGDYMYQRFQYFKNLRMTKQEVKEEYKNIEGDPQIKGRIKQKQREISQRRMMADVPTADVVIKNPTHFAVALKYDRENANAPVVVAKGQDNIAFRIIKIAEENEVAVVENVPLARALYASVEVGMEIPKEFYNPVAEILAHIYSKDESESAQRVNAV
jgi:flagellar biosynthetic protein FlhB